MRVDGLHQVRLGGYSALHLLHVVELALQALDLVQPVGVAQLLDSFFLRRKPAA